VRVTRIMLGGVRGSPGKDNTSNSEKHRDMGRKEKGEKRRESSNNEGKMVGWKERPIY